MKIIQYSPLWAAQKALSSAGTFCLNSIQYYIELEDTADGVGDKMEMKVDYSGGGGGELIEAAIISCWCIPEDQEDPIPDWGILGGDRAVALLSSVESVAKYIEDHATALLEEHWFLSHGKVEYYDTFDCEDFRRKDILFYKRKKFLPQREYCFAMRRSCMGTHLESLVFRNKELDTFPQYIDQVFVNPSTNKDEHAKLHYAWYQTDAMSKFKDWERAYKT